MSLFAILLAVTQTAPLAPPPAVDTETDVVVIGQRLRDWRGSIKSAGGGPACTTIRSTGDAEIDAVGCAVMQRCVAGHQDAMTAAGGKGVSRRKRRDMMAVVNTAMTACMNDLYPPAIQALADRRAGTGATQ